MLAFLVAASCLKMTACVQASTASDTRVFKLIWAAGWSVQPSEGKGSLLSKEGLTMRAGYIPQSPDFGYLTLWRIYRPSKHVSQGALDDFSRRQFEPTGLHYYVRIDGDVEVSAKVPMRKDTTPEECGSLLRADWNELKGASIVGLNPSEGFPEFTLPRSAKPDMGTIFDFLTTEDLVYLTDDVWGWKNRASGGSTGGWKHQIELGDTRVSLFHPNVSEVVNGEGVGLNAQITLLEGANREAILDKLKAEGLPEMEFFWISPSGIERIHVNAYVHYGKGMSLQDLHNRIEKFAKIVGKYR